MPEVEETVLEVDLDALAHNYHYLRSKVKSEVKFMAVVKAFGYGSDVVGVSEKLEELGADYLAVAYTSEGIQLRKAGIQLPILIFHPQPVHFQEILDHCLEPGIYSEYILREFIAITEKSGLKDYPVHVKFNTGLNRLGFSGEETPVVTELLKKTDAVKTASIYSHLAASADWRERKFTLKQINSFKEIAVNFHEKMNFLPLLHICNTSGILNYPEAEFDMVRAGIGLYGFGNDENEDKKLIPVGTLKTVISQTRELKAGETVSYNRNFKAEKPTRIGVLPLGYNDGIARKYGNGKTSVLVNGEYAPVIGDICMDMMMIDITGISCKERDEVIIFGGRPNAVKFAAAGETISYELITGISQRVKRKLVENGKNT